MTHRYPFAPLAAAMGLSEHQAAIQLGVSGSTEQQYRRDGMSEKVADRQAAKAGLVAYEVWPELLDRAIDDQLERRRQIARDSARRRYREDPEVREKRKAAAARWRAESPRALAHQPSRQPEARRAQGRSYYQRNRERILARARERHAQRRQQDAA